MKTEKWLLRNLITILTGIEVFMDREYDFSKGERGKFYRPGAALNLPIYLEPEIREFVEEIAVKKGLDAGTIVNKLIKKNIQMVKEIT